MQVRLERCIFSDTSPPSLPLLQVDNSDASGDTGSRAGFYADEEGPEVCEFYGPGLEGGAPKCMEQTAWPLTATDGGVFLGSEEEWIIATKQV